jgi:hypothetical protein
MATMGMKLQAWPFGGGGIFDDISDPIFSALSAQKLTAVSKTLKFAKKIKFMKL